MDVSKSGPKSRAVLPIEYRPSACDRDPLPHESVRVWQSGLFLSFNQLAAGVEMIARWLSGQQVVFVIAVIPRS